MVPQVCSSGQRYAVERPGISAPDRPGSVEAVSTLPTFEQVLHLPAPFDQPVTEDYIDQNGHMNIGDYFRLGSWAPWRRMAALGMDEHYISQRQMSFFTVGHHISYLGELRLGERFSVHAGFVERTAKALHGVGIVLDREHERLSCMLEATYVHVSMQSRRATEIPDDIATNLDADIVEHPWLGEVATGLRLRRPR